MIVEKRFPEGDQFPFVRSDGEGIQVEFVDPDADATDKLIAAPVAETDHPFGARRCDPGAPGHS